VVQTSARVQQGTFLPHMTWVIEADSEHDTQTAIPFLIGTKFDTFATFPRDEQEEITKQAKRFAKAMHASLIFCSTSASINVQKIFKIVLAKAFDLKCVIPEIEGVGEPVLLYVDV
jgi:GTP-binding protein of the ras superfamily involved in termination of M-phase